jgi:TRAP-type C4-dicarboxylate transport system permease small subunit
MHRLGRVLGRISELTTILGGLAIVLMMFQITLDVSLRATIGKPLPGTITLVSYYYMIIAAFIPLAYNEMRDSHISVEVLVRRLPGRIQHHLAGWMLLFPMAIFGGLTLRSWQEAMKKFDVGASMVQGDSSFAIWPSYFVLPVSFGLMAVIAAFKFLIYITGAQARLSESVFGPASSDTSEKNDA